jgi:hypothetical protein
MPAEQREAVVRAIAVFPHGMCCGICTHNQLGPACLDDSSGIPYSGNVNSGREAATIASQIWPGTSQELLSQLLVPGATQDVVRPQNNDVHLWGANPWLQQPLQQQGLSAAKDNFERGDVEKLSQDVEVDDADDDIDDIESEIYGRAVRFLDEISTDESGSEDQALPMRKEVDHINCPTLTIKDPLYSSALFASMWNPQEPAWATEINGQERSAINYWAIQSSDYLCK